MPNHSALDGAKSLVSNVMRYGEKLGSAASVRRPQGRGRRAREARPRLVSVTLNVRVIGIAGQIRHDKTIHPRALNARVS